jgi:integrase
MNVVTRRFVPSTATDAHERAKDFLDETEMEKLLEAARRGRHGARNHLLILLMYRHGLRASEVVELRVNEINLERARTWVRRAKNGLSTEHPLQGDELRAIKRYLRLRNSTLPWLFASERGAPLTRKGVDYIVRQAAARAGLRGVHAHTLRHSCGFALANRGVEQRVLQDWLGHRDPKHTSYYTRIAARRFDGLWS